MSYPVAAIRQAIREVLEGTTGSVRTVTAGKFLSGVFEGQTDLQQRSRALRKTADPENPEWVHRFDVRLGRMTNHESTPVAAIGNHRIVSLPVTISVTTHTQARILDDRRDEVLALINSDLDTAVQALTWPGNLTQTFAAVATNIVSGLMLGPEGNGYPSLEVTEEDWEKSLIRSLLGGSVLLVVTQPS